MTQASDPRTPPQPEPLRISRVFRVPRATLFKAWSSAEHVSRWFSPTGYSIPEARVEMHAGGTFDWCMRAPDGVEHWTHGHVVEVKPLERIVLDLHVTDAAGNRLFRAHTEVDFANEPGGTRLDVVQTYTFEQPELAAQMVKGAPTGWSQTLDKLDTEALRMSRLGITHRSASHSSFEIERTYPASVERVYAAFSDFAAKSKWFGGDPAAWASLERHMDFRVGGSERAEGRWNNGVVTRFDATYLDIVPLERIIYIYEMHLDGRKISASLATLQFHAEADGRTRLTVTEQGAFLDGYDDAGSREHGTGYLLDRLGTTL